MVWEGSGSDCATAPYPDCGQLHAVLAASTSMWDLAESPIGFAKRVLDLGCRVAVLDVRIAEDRVREVAGALRSAGLPIAALEPPHPEEAGKLAPARALFPLASTDPDHRRIASRVHTRAIALASELEIATLVVHAGRLPDEPPEDLARSLSRETEAAQRAAVRTVLDARASLVGPTLDALRKSLDELLPEAERRHVTIALVNRGDLYELPTYQESDRLQREFAGAPLAPWLDLAAAHRIEAMALKKARAWIEANHERFAGAFLHDTRLENDAWVEGLAPGEGAIDWSALGGESLVKIPCALALPHDADPAKVVDGIDRVQRLFFKTKA